MKISTTGDLFDFLTRAIAANPAVRDLPAISQTIDKVTFEDVAAAEVSEDSVALFSSRYEE